MNNGISFEHDYNLSLGIESLSKQEILNPNVLKLITYSKPHDTCNGREVHLGNMAGGFPFEALGHTWKSVEFLYLLGEWSKNNEEHLSIQKDVLTAPSGYAAKRYKKSKHKKQIREDFPTFRLHWMTWCIWQKCLGSQDFRNHLLLLPTDHIIVEVVKNDPIWAAYYDEAGNLRGGNAVGKILTICRNCLEQGTEPNIDRRLLNDSNIYILGQKVEF